MNWGASNKNFYEVWNHARQKTWSEKNAKLLIKYECSAPAFWIKSSRLNFSTSLLLSYKSSNLFDKKDVTNSEPFSLMTD